VYVPDTVELHDAIDAVNVTVTVTEFVGERDTDAVVEGEVLGEAETDFTVADWDNEVVNDTVGQLLCVWVTELVDVLE
jgi:hypothetical protein